MPLEHDVSYTDTFGTRHFASRARRFLHSHVWDTTFCLSGMTDQIKLLDAGQQVTFYEAAILEQKVHRPLQSSLQIAFRNLYSTFRVIATPIKTKPFIS
ncbi:hypothetical protein PHYBLDRAFT_137916 [Phycomyces blakesleeanus NRRL 1555(-)]|uniref:Uncharacterized protein n=1 Tax=Phycomyces blakesleeanus (strain ATCC 8743b / DSM 1359 / FGSC 10004 / NBRC 33097 / NRRL 1555) TaxID=763407 RepID=A0A167QVX3_PHYB8|nr:hypothetical protein PHYBLDRAFT_137916 [Phycomyces blakesleeanus NRRL 1555(-)]OAD80358.1 hypothetical protein PHYBLDRAFT_137916 [Phycomyces blakesleeanus NRRL 1555(-)]|eukprot:XP_018298398.1 hypothetical protein PHYBLDRAFT_137916 [Phycomyces blakesleeanus NRRL 1555(-)]